MLHPADFDDRPECALMAPLNSDLSGVFSQLRVHDQPTAFLDVFSRHTIYDVVFSQADTSTILYLQRTCRQARLAATDYLARAFNINRHLSRFFSDPKAFRSLQARTATVISGSGALQFFQRDVYPESDLDLYVPTFPLIGYSLSNCVRLSGPSGLRERSGSLASHC
jgi:hypothetical protein